MDISAFEVTDGRAGSLKQLGMADGGKWGATNVDKRFASFLQVPTHTHKKFTHRSGAIRNAHTQLNLGQL